jgi:hypothetical protein
LADYANFSIVIISSSEKVRDLKKIVHINNYHLIENSELAYYQGAEIAMIEGQLKSKRLLIALQ